MALRTRHPVFPKPMTIAKQPYENSWALLVIAERIKIMSLKLLLREIVHVVGRRLSIRLQGSKASFSLRCPSQFPKDHGTPLDRSPGAGARPQSLDFYPMCRWTARYPCTAFPIRGAGHDSPVIMVTTPERRGVLYNAARGVASVLQ